MNKKLVKLGIAGIAGITLAMATPVHAEKDNGYGSRDATPMNQIVLKPGWRSSCSSNFVIENLGKNPADIQITMGKDAKIKDRIHQWDKRGYDLIQSLSFAKQLGKTVDIDDVAMIKNTSKDSKVSIHC